MGSITLTVYSVRCVSYDHVNCELFCSLSWNLDRTRSCMAVFGYNCRVQNCSASYRFESFEHLQLWACSSFLFIFSHLSPFVNEVKFPEMRLDSHPKTHFSNTSREFCRVYTESWENWSRNAYNYECVCWWSSNHNNSMKEEKWLDEY